MFAVDAETQLPDDLLLLTDKMSMAVSLECRVPLARPPTGRTGGAMPAAIKVRDGRLKHLMKAALADLLPDDILDRQKRGFGTPMGAWLKRELAPLLRGCWRRGGSGARALSAAGSTAIDGRPRRQPHRRHRRPARADEPRDLEPHLPRPARSGDVADELKSYVA
jgi:hypothetical protein